MDVGSGKSAPAHAHDIETHQIGERTLDKTERNHVGAHELAHRCLTAEYDKVPDRYVAAQHDVVGEGHVVADHAVVPDMRTHHQKAAIPHLGDAATILRSRIQRDTLADVAVGADQQPRWTAPVFHGLRW